MKRKDVIHWILAILIADLGIAISTKSGMGLSMIAACPYALHHWLVQKIAWFSQGTAEYVFEALLLCAVCAIVKKFKPAWLLSFMTAVISGFAIDMWLSVLGGSGVYASMAVRVIALFAGMCVTSLGIAFFFRTRMPLQVYELAVTEITAKYGYDIKKVKLGFDICMLLIAVIMGLVLEGRLVGMGPGTVIMTFANSFIIAFCGKYIDKVEENIRRK